MADLAVINDGTALGKAIGDKLARDGAIFADAEVTRDLAVLALRYARESNAVTGFMGDMARMAREHGKLRSVAMYRGVLNCLLAEQRRANREADQRAATATRTVPQAVTVAVIEPIAPLTIGNGYYTVVLDSGDRRTLRLNDGVNKYTGCRWVSLLTGPINTSDYERVMLVRADGSQVWLREYRADAASSVLGQAVRFLLSADTDRTATFGKAFALASGTCYRCKAPLTTPESIATGLGEICADKLGIPWTADGARELAVVG